MELEIIKNEEKLMNAIMCVFCAALAIAALLYVLLFNHAGPRDCVVLSITLCSFIIRLFEKKLGKYAKYFYISLVPALGALTMVVGTPGVFGAMQMAYFLMLFLAVPYYDLSVVKICVIVTIAVNGLAMLLFPESYLAQ